MYDNSEPYVQEELHRKNLDAVENRLPVCTLCRQRLYPGARIHTARHQIICSHCLEELEENEDIVELE